MKKMTTALLFLAAALTAGELYFTSDTISYGNINNLGDKVTGDYYPYESKLVNETEDTIILDSTVVDSVTNSFLTSRDFDTDSLIWSNIDISAGLFSKRHGEETKINRKTYVLFPMGYVDANLDRCDDNTGYWAELSPEKFDTTIVRIWIHTSNHYTQKGVVKSIPLTIGGYYIHAVEIPTAVTPTSALPTVNKRAVADRNIYNMRGQIVGTQGTDVNNLAAGVVVQQKSKMNTQLYQKAE